MTAKITLTDFIEMLDEAAKTSNYSATACITCGDNPDFNILINSIDPGKIKYDQQIDSIVICNHDVRMVFPMKKTEIMEAEAAINYVLFFRDLTISIMLEKRT